MKAPYFKVNDHVFFLCSEELRAGPITAVIIESTEKEQVISYKIKLDYLIVEVKESGVSATIEGLFKRLFEQYKATAKGIRGRTGAVGSKLEWEKIFTAENCRMTAAEVRNAMKPR